MEARLRRLKLILALSLTLPPLTSCGGGGGGNSNKGSGTWEPGVFLPAETFEARCASPRTGNDPNGQPWPDVAGSVLDENNWLRSWSNDTYLWYDEIIDEDPGDFTDPVDYFEVLRTFETTESGNPKDRFHFWLPTDDWIALSQSGVSVGYGIQWVIIESTPPRRVLAANTNTGDPVQGIVRGTEVFAIDGVDVVNSSDADTINAALSPSNDGETHEFAVRHPDGTEEILTLTASKVTLDPVQNVQVVEGAMGVKVGYMLFNDHIATAEKELKAAVEELERQGVEELVLDIRYNGGGFLAIASQLSYMIAGSVSTEGRVFETLIANDKHTPEFLGHNILTPVPFIDTTRGLSEPEGQQLPALDLPRVFVLTGYNTCSASESIINGLRGVDVEVIQIGATTCGKPYGFFSRDNCGVTYSTIQMQLVNAKGFGDYADGFSPDGPGGGASLPGCAVGDDFEHQLGSIEEARFATAINYIESGSCGGTGVMSMEINEDVPETRLATPEGKLVKSQWRNNRIYGR